jgi:CRP/FNR family transcriptional regulator, cyclic AMP receptor protein
MDPGRLTSIPLFSELTEQESERLATFATETSVREGELLVREGEFSTELIAIEEGTAEVLRGDARIATLGAGDVVGETGLLRREPRNADVVATSPMRVFKLTHWEIRRMSPDTVRRLQELIEQRSPDPDEHP